MLLAVIINLLLLLLYLSLSVPKKALYIVHCFYLCLSVFLSYSIRMSSAC